MTKLHEILAVEPQKEGYFKNAIPEMINLFKNKVSHFNGFQRTLKLFGEETAEKLAAEKAESEFQALTSTVPSELKYLEKVVGEYLDVVFQKDEANQRAVADIEIDGEVIASSVPASTLLGLENKLKQLRPVYEQIPTLQPGTFWNKAAEMGRYIWRDANDEVRTKTKKSFDFKILVAATDKHPAQIEKWDTTEAVGVFTKTRWCGMLSVHEKSELLERFDKLAAAVKKARCRANDVEINHRKISDKIFSFLHQFEE